MKEEIYRKTLSLNISLSLADNILLILTYLTINLIIKKHFCYPLCDYLPTRHEYHFNRWHTEQIKNRTFFIIKLYLKNQDLCLCFNTIIIQKIQSQTDEYLSDWYFREGFKIRSPLQHLCKLGNIQYLKKNSCFPLITCQIIPEEKHSGILQLYLVKF